MKKLALLASTIGLALGLAGPAAAQVEAEDWDAVVAAAREEGTVVFYASFIGAEFQWEIVRTFEAEYGIPVQVLDVRATELRERIRTEQVTGNMAGDVHWSGFTLMPMVADGFIQGLGPVPNAANVLPEFQYLVTDQYVPTHVGFFGIMVNTNLVSEENAPRSWHDLLDPQWQGRILSDDFRAQGGGLNLFSATYHAFGREFHEALSRQGIVFSRDAGNDERRVARGEYPIRIPQFYGSMAALEGLPVRFIMPEEGGSYVQGLMAVLNGAPHPNAARVFVNHYLSEQVQSMLADNGFRPVVDVADRVTTEQGRFAASVELLGTTAPDEIDTMLQAAQELYP